MEDVNLGIAKREEIMSLGGDSKIGEKEPPLWIENSKIRIGSSKENLETWEKNSNFHIFKVVDLSHLSWNLLQVAWFPSVPHLHRFDVTHLPLRWFSFKGFYPLSSKTHFPLPNSRRSSINRSSSSNKCNQRLQTTLSLYLSQKWLFGKIYLVKL